MIKENAKNYFKRIMKKVIGIRIILVKKFASSDSKKKSELQS